MVGETARLHGSIDLGRRDARMPEHLLDRPQVGPAAERLAKETGRKVGVALIMALTVVALFNDFACIAGW